MKKYMLSRQDLSDCMPLGITPRGVQLHAGDLGTFVHGIHLGAVRHNGLLNLSSINTMAC